MSRGRKKKVEVKEDSSQPEEVVAQPALVEPEPVPTPPVQAPVVVKPDSITNSVIVELNGKRYKKNWRVDGTTDLTPLE